MSVPKRSVFRAGLLAALLAAGPLLALAADGAGSTPPAMAVEGYGGTHTAPGAMERPDKSLHYKVLFSITKASQPGEVNMSLSKVARFLNLLAADGVHPQPGDIAAVVHGPATPLVMNDASYAAKESVKANPNLELIDRLRKAGVSVRVCSQAMAGQNITPEQVDKRVQIDVAALVTIPNLELRGYALIPD